MRLLVIGGAGYVGSHFCYEAIRQGHRVAVLDNFSTGHRTHVASQSPLFEADCRDTSFVAQAIDCFRPDAVLHFAAKSLVAESVQEPNMYYEHNVGGTLSIVEAIRESGSSCGLVFSSTCAVFGDASDEPLAEDAPKAPTSPYGHSKLACEYLLQDAAKAYGIPTVVLRYFNACGADSSGRIGECHEPETHLIPNLVKAARDGSPVSIFGDDFPTPDGTCVRDYIHVTDLASGHLAACASFHRRGGFKVFHLGTGTGRSNLEIVEAVRQATGRELAYSYGPRRSGDAAILVADPRRAQVELNFRVRHSDMTQIVAGVWRWETGEP